LVLAPLAVFVNLGLPHSGFAFVSALILVLGGWEWAGLSGLSRAGRAAYAGFLAAIFALTFSFIGIHPELSSGLLSAGLVWWVVALVQVLRFPAGSGFWHKSPVARGLAGLLVLMPAWVGLVALHAENPYLSLLVIALVSFADIGAYFAGRAFGRHKLAPQVSPGKTWEGLVGALTVTVVVAWIASRYLSVPGGVASDFIALCVAAVLVSVLGDLTESMFKRMVGAKDSGGLLPGHGGMLDRVDSLTAAAPFFAMGVLWLKVAA
jgi:phosphatidate cytidylyltransferase